MMCHGEWPLDRGSKTLVPESAAEHVTVVSNIAIGGPDRLGQPSGCTASTAKS